MGIGDWGLGIGPNPQSPIPNPQSPIKYLKDIFYIIKTFKILFQIIYFSIKINV
jgi:hypothetical protein